MPYPAPQPITPPAWRQTPTRARRVAQALCLHHGEDIDTDDVAHTLDVPAGLIGVYLEAARAERDLRNIPPGERMPSTMIARAMSTSSNGRISPAAVRRYLADPSGIKNRESEQHAKIAAKRPGESARKWPATLVLERILEWHALYGTWPTGYDWTRAHATSRGGEHLARWNTRRWPDARTVRRIFYTFPLAVAAAQRTQGHRRPPTKPAEGIHDGHPHHDQV
jgi:hypothetical protein